MTDRVERWCWSRKISSKFGFSNVDVTMDPDKNCINGVVRSEA